MIRLIHNRHSSFDDCEKFVTKLNKLGQNLGIILKFWAIEYAFYDMSSYQFFIGIPRALKFKFD